MSAKNVIQKLQDSQLIRLFLQLVEYFHLQYEKSCKQISYKCYQATWALCSIKATGYGRTQSEAFKHSLRNLLQLLIEEPIYTQFFVQTLTSQNFLSSYNKSKTLIKKQPLNQYSTALVKKAANSKTEGHESLQKQQYQNSQLKILNSIHKVNSNIKHDLNTSQDKTNYQNKCKQLLIKQSLQYSNNQQTKLNKNDSQSKFNNMNNCYQLFQKPNKNQIEKRKQQSSSQQFRKASKELSQLQSYLSQVNQENQYIKNKLKKLNEEERTKEKENENNGYDNQLTHKHLFKVNEIELDSLKNKLAVPKLKLDILPNYHKKSQKSLNESLLAAYNEKRNPSVKKIMC